MHAIIRQGNLIHMKSIVRLKRKKILKTLIGQTEIFTMHVLKNKKNQMEKNCI